MKSRIVEAVGFRHLPVALLWADERPEDAKQFSPGKWGCVMWLATGAARGRTAVCDRDTFGCIGGGVGMGFGDQYVNFTGGKGCFCRFLSCGNETSEDGRQAAERVRPFLREETYDDFVHGERYIKTPEGVHRFIEQLPITDIPAHFVVFKPLADVDVRVERPRVVIFFADPDQLSALVVLANYGRESCDNVIIPFAAGCQAIGIIPLREAQSPSPRAVVGLTDLSARLYVRQQLGGDLLTFTAPMALFEEMEANVPGSFLQRPTWQQLRRQKAEAPTRHTREPQR